ncbi:MAG: sulfite exporter TauE/SafE family protein [Oceanococcaceae bacterium]
MFTLDPLAALPVPLGIAVALVVGLGFFVGMVSAAFGVGGGFVITPFCHAVLGMPAPLAVATSMGQIPLLSASGTWRYLRAGSVDFRRALLLLVGALPSAQVVAWWLGRQSPDQWPVLYANQTLPDLLLLAFFTLCIGGLGVYNLWAGLRRDRQATLRTRAPLGHTGLILWGTVFGSMSALLGIGGGFFAVPVFTYLCGMTPVQAVATSLFAVLVTSAITTAHYLWLGQIHFAISLVIAVGSIVGARIGAGMALASRPGQLLITLGGAQILICAGYIALRL